MTGPYDRPLRLAYVGAAFRRPTSEWNIVVGDRFHRRLIATGVRHRCGATTVHRGSAAAAPATAAEQGDPVRFNLRRVSLVAVLVVPLAGLQATLDVDLLALRQVLLQALHLLAPQDDAVPFGFFLALPALVVPHLGCRKVQRRDRSAAWRVAKLRIAPQIAHEDDFVHASHRCPSPLWGWFPAPSWAG